MYAKSIGAARKLTAMQPPSMLLLDRNLPDEHGFDLLEGAWFCRQAAGSDN